MQSNATMVEADIAGAPPERQPAMSAIRALCREYLPGHEESMLYGMVTFTRNGAAEFAFASHKGYLSLYSMKQIAVDPLRDEFVSSGVKLGKGCIRYSRPERVSLKALTRLLQATAASDGEPCQGATPQLKPVAHDLSPASMGTCRILALPLWCHPEPAGEGSRSLVPIGALTLVVATPLSEVQGSRSVVRMQRTTFIRSSTGGFTSALETTRVRGCGAETGPGQSRERDPSPADSR